MKITIMPAAHQRHRLNVTPRFPLPQLVAGILAVGFLAAAAVPANSESGLSRNETRRLIEVADYCRNLEAFISGGPVDLEGVIEKTGLEPADITRWVRQNIEFEPYNGIMKGPLGTLVSGSGSSADQALLLAVLMENAGLSVKLVSGQIAVSTLPRTNLDKVDIEPAEPSENELAELAEKLGVSLSAVTAKLHSAQVIRQQFLEELWSRTWSDLESLAAAVRAARLPVPAPDGTDGPQPADKITHWWVKTAGSEYDPVLESGAGSATETYSREELPEELYHQLTIRLLIQREEGDTAAPLPAPPETVLEVTMRTADLFGESLVLGNVPLDSAEALTALRRPTPEDVMQALAATTQFQPQLATPLGVFSGHPFDIEGNRLEVKGGRIEAVRDLGGAMWGLFAPAPTDEPTTRLAGHWLELTLREAGNNRETDEPLMIRREILRRPGDPQAILDLLTLRELLVMPDQLTSEWMTGKALRYAADWAEYEARMLTEPTLYLNLDSGLNLEEFARRPHLTSELYAFGLARRRELPRLREAVSPGTAYWNRRPLLISHVRRLLLADDQFPARMQAGLDILNNELSVQGPPADDWSQHLPFAAGILDTALELTLNPVLHSGDRRANASLSLENTLSRRMNPRVEPAPEAGFTRIYVSPADPPAPPAWYQVSLASGTSLGMIDGGGQAMTEYAQRVNIALQLRGVLKFYADMFHCLGLALSMPLAMDPGEQQMELAECVWDLACGKLKDLATSFTKVDVNWTNIILKRTADKGYSEVCSGLRKQVLGR